MPIPQHVSGSRQERRDEPVPKPELPAQVNRGRLVEKQRIGTAIDYPAIDALGDNDASESGLRFEQSDVDPALA
jgi:hypothetical protein